MVLQVPPGVLFAEAVCPTAWTTTSGSGSCASLNESHIFYFSGIRIAYRDDEMKVVGINGSARKDGNTAILINYVFGELEKEDIKTEMVQLSGKDIRGCKACFKCMSNKDG